MSNENEKKKYKYDKVEDFTDLEVWKLAHQVRLNVYKFTKLLSKEERYNRVEQMRRAGSSIASNIAEGFGRYHYQENIQFCRQARGSLDELRDNVIAAKDLNQAPASECEKLWHLLIQCRRLLNGYIRYLKNQKARNP